MSAARQRAPDGASFALMKLPSHRHIYPMWRKGRFARWGGSLTRRGVDVARYFTLRQYGSMEMALLMAIAFRDETDRKLPRLSRAELCATVRDSNTSGVPGVRRVTYNDGHRKSDRWQATIHPRGHRKKLRSFAVSVHGEEEAYRLAVEARRQFLIQLTEYIEDGDHEPAPRPVLQRPRLKDAPVESPYPPSSTRKVDKVKVHKVHNRAYAKNGSVYLNVYWCASMTGPDGHLLQRRFPIKRLGEDEAKRRAVEQRRIWERQFGRRKNGKTSRKGDR